VHANLCTCSRYSVKPCNHTRIAVGAVSESCSFQSEHKLLFFCLKQWGLPLGGVNLDGVSWVVCETHPKAIPARFCSAATEPLSCRRRKATNVGRNCVVSKTSQHHCNSWNANAATAPTKHAAQSTQPAHPTQPPEVRVKQNACEKPKTTRPAHAAARTASLRMLHLSQPANARHHPAVSFALVSVVVRLPAHNRR
jgi:hypothetical protein